MYRIAICYPNQKDAQFNEEYYSKKHLPEAVELLGPEIVKSWTVEKGIKFFGSEPSCAYVGVLYVYSLEEFKNAFKTIASKLQEDMPNFCNTSPIFLCSEVLV